MMEKLQSRTTAALITVCVVILSVLLGAKLTLGGMREEVLDQSYYYLWSDMLDVTAEAENLLVVAQRNLDSASPAMRAVRRGIDGVENAYSLSRLYDASIELRDALDQLDEELATAPLDSQDRSYHQSIVLNIDSSYTRVGYNDYNGQAAQFNRELEKFPANLLSAVTGVDRLELYQ